MIASLSQSIAHRGGALLPQNLGRENTIEAFAHAVDLGCTYLETDVRCTKDGHVYAFHDENLTRLFGLPVRFSDLTAAEVAELRLRGEARIATLEQLLSTFPTAVFNIDFKDDASVEPALRVIAKTRAETRVVIASFSHSRITRVRNLAPHVATSASRWEVGLMRVGKRIRGEQRPHAIQIPPRIRGIQVFTPRLLEGAHSQRMAVHVWTINEEPAMHVLLDAGVDGIITDRPDVLKYVLHQRGK